MSYDLLVFEPTAAPRTREEFRVWWLAQSEWSEGHSYDDASVTSERLKLWYQDIEAEWPCLNGPCFQERNLDSPKLTDYSIGKVVIYACFAWTEAENAYPVVRALAVKHGVGFYDVSGDEGDGEIHFPGDALREPSDGSWRNIAKQFRELRDSE